MPKFIALVLVSALAVAATGCGVVRKAAQDKPAPVVMSWETVHRTFADNEAHVRIRNTGTDGYVKITVTNAGKEWTQRAYFNAGEERTVCMVLQGCTRFSGTSYCEVEAD